MNNYTTYLIKQMLNKHQNYIKELEDKITDLKQRILDLERRLNYLEKDDNEW